jgi:hypothetical protein
MCRRNLVLLSLAAILAGCIEGKKPTPLRRVQTAAPPPVELKAQPQPPEQPAKQVPEKPDKEG